MTDEVNPDLAQRVERAEGASRDLDAEIAVALRLVPFFNPGTYAVPLEYAPDEPRGPGHIGVWAIPGDGTRRLCHSRPAPHYTASLDAALTLVPEGWVKRLSEIRFGMWTCELWCGDKSFRSKPDAVGVHGSWPMAVMIAALHARATESGNG